MKIDKKYLNIMMISLITIIIYSLINNSKVVMDFFGGIFSNFTVFVIGAIIAFLLNPLLNLLEKKLKLSRKKSIGLIYGGLILLVTLFIVLVIPKVFNNLTDLVQNFPKFLKNLEGFLERITLEVNNKFPLLNLTLDKNQIGKVNGYLISLGENLLKTIGQNLLTVTYSVIKFFVGIVMSLFFLGEKEYFKNLIVEVIRINLPKEKSDKLSFYGQKLYEIFLGYLHGKTLESLLIGFVAFLGLLCFKVPYAVLLWIFITCTNFIPYFGPFIGMAVTATISAFVFPQKIIYILLFLILLQQIDSWYFEPRIIGNKLNLKVFWGIAAITIGGSIAGPIGIVVAAPLASFIKTMYNLKKEEIDGKSSN